MKNTQMLEEYVVEILAQYPYSVGKPSAITAEQIIPAAVSRELSG